MDLLFRSAMDGNNMRYIGAISFLSTSDYFYIQIKINGAKIE